MPYLLLNIVFFFTKLIHKHAFQTVLNAILGIDLIEPPMQGLSHQPEDIEYPKKYPFKS